MARSSTPWPRPSWRSIAIASAAFLAVAALVVVAGVAAVVWILNPSPIDPPAGIRLYTAKKIISIDSERPFATAIAVEDGRILAIGDRDDVERSIGDRPFVADDRFADKIVMPGFIDPHIHPTLAAAILPMEIVSAMEWTTPSGPTTAVRGHDDFLERLSELDRALPDANEFLTVWGYHAPYHGSLSRRDLDAISTTRPIMVWQRSCHEMFFNTAALEALSFDRDAWDASPQASWEEGHLWEAAVLRLGEPMMRVLAHPGRYLRGLEMMSKVLHRGGLTTVGEQGFPQLTALGELLMLHIEMRDPDTPYRFALVPNAMFLMRKHADAEAAEREAASWLDYSSDRIRVMKHVKYYVDGAIYSQLMQLSEPYLDGHHGEWMMEPENQAAVLETFWQNGWNIHIHVNGDAGLDLVLDQVEAQRARTPGISPRIVLEHYGYAREEQHARLKALDIVVSNNAYYLHELAPIYAEYGMGAERAADISPLGGLARAGVAVSFHSDYLMAPAEPLRQVWVAVNRVASDGAVWGADQRLELDLALRAITLEAAWSLGLEDEIGSLEVGKRADFTILGRDPYAVDPMALADIPIWGTVLGGRLQPLE